MKKMLFAMLSIFALSSVMYAQTSTAANVKVSYVVSADYLNKTKTINKGAVAGIANTDSTASTTIKFVKDVTVAYPIAADTILVGQFSLNSKIVLDTLFYGLVPATAGNPFTIPINRVIDSTYFMLRTAKGSKTNTTYRNTPY
jgi:hypothetical protein